MEGFSQLAESAVLSYDVNLVHAASYASFLPVHSTIKQTQTNIIYAYIYSIYMMVQV